MQEMVNGLAMEERECASPKCNMTFKVNCESSQLYHSSFCESEDKQSDSKKKEWKKWINPRATSLQSERIESERNGSGKKSDLSQIQNLQQNIGPEIVKDMPEEVTKNESEIKKSAQSSIEKTRNVKIKEDVIQGEGTMSEKTKTHEDDIEKEMNTSSSKLKLEEEKMIPQLDSTARLSLIALDVSESMNLLDSSAKQMKELMIKTGSSLDSLNRQISVRCAREAREAIRAKLEISKFVFRVASDKKNGDEKGAAYEQ